MRGTGGIVACHALAMNSVAAFLVLLGTVVFTIVFGFKCLADFVNSSCEEWNSSWPSCICLPRGDLVEGDSTVSDCRGSLKRKPCRKE